MSANPNPARISSALWGFWLGFLKLAPTAKLGGILALKPGYHSYRSRLPGSDYSTGRDVAADKLGPSDKASAIDLTLSTADMIKFTKRLDVAARARDPRLYTSRGPVLREFIGTKDGKTVYCYVLVGGRALGVGADAGPDPGRDKTHLWHIHLSIIRQFCADPAALDGVLSVLAGESLAAWKARTEGDNMEKKDIVDAVLTALRTPMALPGRPAQRLQEAGWNTDLALWSVLSYGMEHFVDARALDNTVAIRTELTALRTVVETLAQAVNAGGGSVDTAAIFARLDQAVDAVRAEVRDAVADLGEGGAEQVRADEG